MQDQDKDQEKKKLLTINNTWMIASDEILKLVLNRDVRISDPEIDEISADESLKKLDVKSSYIYPVTVTSGIIGKCFIAFKTKTLSAIVDLIMGGDGAETIKELDEAHLGILEEVINQIIGALISMLSDKLSRKLNCKIGNPEVPSIQTMGGENVFYTSYKLIIENLSDSTITVIFPARFASELIHQIGLESASAPSMSGSRRAPSGKMASKSKGLPRFDDGKSPSTASSIDKVKDLSVTFSIVLGRTKINVKDLFNLSPGSILELDNLPDDPVELYVNNKFLGYGEILIADDNYGVRIIKVKK